MTRSASMGGGQSVTETQPVNYEPTESPQPATTGPDTDEPVEGEQLAEAGRPRPSDSRHRPMIVCDFDEGSYSAVTPRKQRQ